MQTKKRNSRLKKSKSCTRKYNKTKKYNCINKCTVDKKVHLISEDILKIGEVIGKGNFGQVLMSQAKCPTYPLNSVSWCPTGVKTINVILKELLNTDNYQSTIDFINEINITWHLSNKNKNIVRMFGYTEQLGKPKYLVLEHCNLGSLYSYLTNTNTIMSQSLALLFIKDIVSGMDHIHKLGYIHRDLACRNVLLSDYGKKLIAKVGDFGMARPKYLETNGNYSYFETQKISIPLRWTSLEALSGKYSEKSDLWAFGITVCELYMRGDIPYNNTNNFDEELIVSNKDVQKFVEYGGIHSQPNNCPTVIYDIILRCWDTKKENQICTFKELHKIFKSFKKINTRMPQYF